MERRSATRRWWVLLAMLVGFAALAAIFAARDETSELSPPWNFLVPLVPFAVPARVGGAVAHPAAAPAVRPVGRRSRRRDPQGGEPRDHAGSTTDPRIDDLVVDMREHGTARQFGLIATVQLVGAIAVGAGAAVSDEMMSRVLLAGAAAGMLTGAGLLFRQRRNLIAYRAGGGEAGWTAGRCEGRLTAAGGVPVLSSRTPRARTAGRRASRCCR